jgi:Helix-turn-helix family
MAGSPHGLEHSIGMATDELVSARARALGAAIEPVAAQVYFSPECHEAYAALGFSPSPAEVSGVAMPDGPAYFTSRGSVLGQVSGEVVAATFGVFNPAVVVPLVEMGWARVTAGEICRARTHGAIAQLRRIIGDEPDGLARATELLRRANDGLRPEGRPLYAGLLGLGIPDDPIGAMWRLADRLREFRGDAHVAAWSAAAFDATEIGLLTELYWGLPMRTYIRTRAWSDADLDSAEARLEERGLVAGGAFTDAGRAAREHVETVTDRLCRPIVEGLGDDLDELVGLVGSWSGIIRAAAGYPASGPHDLARAAST